jgi:hypothetical protein
LVYLRSCCGIKRVFIIPNKDSITGVGTRGGLASRQRKTTIQDYEALIRNIVLQPQCRIYAYTHHTQAIYAVGVNVWTGVEWLVMVGMDGVMETAFEIDSEDYLSKLSYVYLGIMGDENEGGDDVAH